MRRTSRYSRFPEIKDESGSLPGRDFLSKGVVTLTYDAEGVPRYSVWEDFPEDEGETPCRVNDDDLSPEDLEPDYMVLEDRTGEERAEVYASDERHAKDLVGEHETLEEADGTAGSVLDGEQP